MGDCFAPGSSCAAILNRFGRREEARLRNLDSSSGELHRIPDAPNFEAEDIGTACWIQRRTIQERVRANEELLRSSNPFAHLEPRRANIEAPIKNWIFACLNHCSPPFHRTTTHPAPVPRRTGRTAPPEFSSIPVRFRFIAYPALRPEHRLPGSNRPQLARAVLPATSGIQDRAPSPIVRASSQPRTHRRAPWRQVP